MPALRPRSLPAWCSSTTVGTRLAPRIFIVPPVHLSLSIIRETITLKKRSGELRRCNLPLYSNRLFCRLIDIYNNWLDNRLRGRAPAQAVNTITPDVGIGGMSRGP